MGLTKSPTDTAMLSEDRLQGKLLENVHSSFIRPSTATPSENEWLSPSTLDLMFIPFYTPILCTFTLKDHRFGSAGEVVQHLKDSLADALVLFYPLAGRVVAKDGPPRMHCNDAGAVFTVASVDVELAELRTDDFQPQPLLSGLTAAGLRDYPALPEMEGGHPALIIQVTHFKCRGITLATNWAEEDEKYSPVKKTAEFRSKPEQPRIAAKIMEFTKDDIAKLKKQALEHDPNVQLSRADCLSTHLWRTLARAKNLSNRSRVKLISIVEGRKKLSLSPGYFGNVIGFKTIITTVDELLNGPFGSTASLIHSAIPTVTAEWFQDLVDFTHLLQPGHNMFGEDEISPECMFGLSYLIRFPFYEVDFGFGVPAHSMRNTMGARDGLVFVVRSSHGPEHMVAMVNLNPQAVTKFVSMAYEFPE